MKIGKWFCLLRITIAIKHWYILIIKVHTDNMKIIENENYENKRSYENLKTLLVYVCVCVFVVDSFLTPFCSFLTRQIVCNEKYQHLWLKVSCNCNVRFHSYLKLTCILETSSGNFSKISQFWTWKLFLIFWYYDIVIGLLGV